MAAQRAVFMDRISALPIEQVKDDPQLLAVATAAGRIAFANNCQPCHGAGGEGRIGYPEPRRRHLAVGRQARRHPADHHLRHPQRQREGAQQRDAELRRRRPAHARRRSRQVADYVWTRLLRPCRGRRRTSPRASALFAENCAVCHGANGEGGRSVGAPPLKSAVHLYGDRRETIVAQVTNPRLGVMPAWEKKTNATGLDEATIKSVALYVHALGGGE